MRVFKINTHKKGNHCTLRVHLLVTGWYLKANVFENIPFWNLEFNNYNEGQWIYVYTPRSNVSTVLYL